MKVYRDSLLKNKKPGGDWHPGQGDNPRYGHVFRGEGKKLKSKKKKSLVPEPRHPEKNIPRIQLDDQFPETFSVGKKKQSLGI